MDKRKIVWTDHAKSEFKNILDFYIQRNQSNTYSTKLLKLVDEGLHIIADNPSVALQNIDEVSRTIIIDHFSLIFDYDDDLIIVLSFWDDRQDPQNKLTRKKHGM